MSLELNSDLANSFILSNNISKYEIKKIAGDASFRSYYRVSTNLGSYILMYAPPLYEKIDSFILIDKFLCDNNFSAPQIYGIDKDNGFILLEDFGDKTYSKTLIENKSKEFEEIIYIKACDCLINLHKSNISSLKIESYNIGMLFREVMLFVDWYLPYIKNIKLSVDQIAIYKSLWFQLFDDLSSDMVIVLRDYHADNLMIIEDRLEYKAVGLLDFQDAVIGSKAYDLVSLLEDARRDVNKELVEIIINYYINKSKINKDIFLRDYAILSLQRNIKILGIFARLAYRDGKVNYLNFIPRVKNHIFKRNDINKNSTNSKFIAISEFIEKLI